MNKKIVAVVGDYGYSLPFRQLGLTIVCSAKPIFVMPKDVALVVFTGGEDVHPSLYKGVDKGISYTNIKRDAFEIGVFNECKQHNIKMTGICRGFQFLNVMAGGRMYQHLENHAISGRHPAYFPFVDKSILVSSTHHQLVKLASGAIPLVWAEPKRSDFYFDAEAEFTESIDREEMEGAFFPNDNALGVQYHPEMMASIEPGRQIFIQMIQDLLSLPRNEMVEKYSRRPQNGRVEGNAKAAG